jgi:hypothetical protein
LFWERLEEEDRAKREEKETEKKTTVSKRSEERDPAREKEWTMNRNIK